jgi:hypothetical protein
MRLSLAAHKFEVIRVAFTNGRSGHDPEPLNAAARCLIEADQP